MRRFIVLLALLAISVPVSMNLAVAGGVQVADEGRSPANQFELTKGPGSEQEAVMLEKSKTVWDEPAALTLEKECVLFGRILGSHVLLFPQAQISEPVYDLPEMTQLGGFDVVNLATGEWQPLALSEDGHFCANVGMGKYDLRGRDSKGRPYVIHSFSIPNNMAANLGTFWVETGDPTIINREGWSSHIEKTGWHEYQEGSAAISLHFEHITTGEAYEECEEWFAECHEDVYDQFSSVIARR